MKVLLCVDQAATKEAIQFAGKIARQLGAHMDLWLILETYDEMVKAQPLLEKERRLLAEISPDVEAQMQKGLAAEILARVKPKEYALIILAFRGRRGLKKVFPRPECVAIVREVRVPLLTLWGHPETVRKVLFCTGGSEVSLTALDFVLPLAGAFGAHVTVLHVREPTPGQYVAEEDEPTGLDGIANPDVRDRVLEAYERARGAGPADLRVVTGDPAERIVALADTEDYDLIAMGRRGLSPVRRLLLGSVAEHVVKHSHVPVLIVPRKDAWPRLPLPPLHLPGKD